MALLCAPAVCPSPHISSAFFLTHHFSTPTGISPPLESEDEELGECLAYATWSNLAPPHSHTNSLHFFLQTKQYTGISPPLESKDEELGERRATRLAFQLLR